MPRFNVTMPQELWDLVGLEAERSSGGNRSLFVRRALQAAIFWEKRTTLEPWEEEHAKALEKALAVGEATSGQRADVPVGPASSRASSPEVEVSFDPLKPETEAKMHAAAEKLGWAEPASRHCERCSAPIKSPVLRRHDACGGGKVVPEPV